MRGPATMEAPAYLDSMTEAQFQGLVVETAQTYGWLVQHIRNMIGNKEGLPDLLMWRGSEYLLAELKVATGTVSKKQRLWHENAAACDVPVHVWRPVHWQEVIVPLLRDGPSHHYRWIAETEGS